MREATTAGRFGSVLVEYLGFFLCHAVTYYSARSARLEPALVGLLHPLQITIPICIFAHTMWKMFGQVETSFSSPGLGETNFLSLESASAAGRSILSLSLSSNNRPGR